MCDEESLLRKKLELEAQLKLISQMLDDLHTHRPNGNTQALPERSDFESHEFKSARPGQALDRYLSRRCGLRITLDRVATDLLEGGIIPPKPAGRGVKRNMTRHHLLIRPLKAKLANAPHIKREPLGNLDKIDPRDITVWIDEVPGPKSRNR